MQIARKRRAHGRCTFDPAGGMCHYRLVSNSEVAVGAGTLRSSAADAVSFPHRWTPAGVTVEAAFTGAHLLHLAAAGCVLNDVYREAERLGLSVRGVRVTASGGFDADTWRSTGIVYAVEVDAQCSQQELDRLLATVDAVAEIPKAIRAGTTVERAFPQRADLKEEGYSRLGEFRPAV
jgi:hypothetical protein